MTRLVRHYCFEIIVLLAISVLFVAFVSNGIVTTDQLYASWFMPFVGILAATIAMSTPAGGGIVFFPIMILLGIAPLQAVGFSLGAQSVGMGIFGTYNWFKTDRAAIVSPIVAIVVPIAIAASLVTILIFPASKSSYLQVGFSCFGIFLAGYIYKHLDIDKSTSRRDIILNKSLVLSLVGVGLAGGAIVGYIGIGVDTLLFFVLTFFFKIDSHKATVTSIVTMGITAMVPFFVHLLIIKNVPLHLWLMVLPGIFLGARLGPWINMRLGQRRILSIFATILVIEFLMTISRFFFS
ncbi:sulfite exporter TauE/SafE family protein [Halobacteriovorax sp. HLS]|uniref:sulfite exporter TauE/SafE family protein n=1 Tax=Halobacteriovorax sp. HLS TaxID=2234000 RepID=UPI0013E33655|nr:sulfite exporter TauE/SafE family protein [Halobacteriovorax sp. HLS]